MSINFLKNKNKCELDNHISFDEGPHIYTIDGDSNYLSVTKWNHDKFEKFDADKIIEKMMKSKNWINSPYNGMTKQEIKQQWSKNGKEASESGTKLHNDIEQFYNKMSVINDSIEYKYFQNFYKDHKHLIPYRTEWMIYDKELKLAGSIDMVFQDKNSKKLHIYDWKRCKEIKMDNKWQKSITPCISHLDDCNYNHYSLQLNTYKYILEKNYDEIVDDMYLICLHPNNENDNYIKIKVNNMTNELDNLMEMRYKQIY